ncbi:MAG: hypothetical protein ACJ0PY_00825 [Flavobacteriaceae bacterium]
MGAALIRSASTSFGFFDISNLITLPATATATSFKMEFTSSSSLLTS